METPPEKLPPCSGKPKPYFPQARYELFDGFPFN
jgi:hypothetical protein